jgi:hypothetical protein
MGLRIFARMCACVRAAPLYALNAKGTTACPTGYAPIRDGPAVRL